MLNILDFEDEDKIYSISGQIEFEIFYDRIKYLVDFYNYSMKCYYDFLDQKHRERKKTKDNIEKILKSAEDQDIDVTEEEIFFLIDEEVVGIRMNFLEYQKMTLIIILFSEVEKLIDNLFESIQLIENIKGINNRLHNLCLHKGLDQEDTNYIIDTFNKLRVIRNKLIHRYDHWDDEIVIDGHTYKGVNQLNDEFLGDLVNGIADSIKKIEKGYI